MVEVILSAAMICLNDGCYPALVGRDTPTGVFTMQLFETTQRVYKGDVLAFHRHGADVYAVHRPPSESRRNFLRGAPERDRRYVTDGCVNVDDAVYEMLRACCNGERLVIR